MPTTSWRLAEALNSQRNTQLSGLWGAVSGHSCQGRKTGWGHYLPLPAAGPWSFSLPFCPASLGHEGPKPLPCRGWKGVSMGGGHNKWTLAGGERRVAPVPRQEDKGQKRQRRRELLGKGATSPSPGTWTRGAWLWGRLAVVLIFSLLLFEVNRLWKTCRVICQTTKCPVPRQALPCQPRPAWLWSGMMGVCRAAFLV